MREQVRGRRRGVAGDGELVEDEYLPVGEERALERLEESGEPRPRARRPVAERFRHIEDGMSTEKTMA